MSESSNSSNWTWQVTKHILVVGEQYNTCGKTSRDYINRPLSPPFAGLKFG